MSEEIKKLRDELKKKVQESGSVRSHYIMPITKYPKSEMPLKIITVGHGIGFNIPKDVCYAMNLSKGKILKVTFELYPKDAEKLYTEKYEGRGTPQEKKKREEAMRLLAEKEKNGM